MNKNSAPSPVRYRVLAVAVFLALAVTALAVPFHSPTVDGTITGDGTDWDLPDLVVDDTADDNLGRTANTRRLWLTWDADNLYLGVTYQDFGDNEALSVFLDLDRGVGPLSAAGLDSAAGNFRLPDDHGFELVLRRGATDGFPGFLPRAFLVTDGDGTVLPLAGAITSAQGFNTGTGAEDDKAAFPFWLNGEFALPWSAIYPDLAGGVPPYAVIKGVAVATSVADSLNGVDSAPSNPGLDRGTAEVLLANLHASVVDADGDGAPDPADGTISGTVTLPQDAGTATVTVTAALIEFAGREPGAPLSMTTTAAGVRTWTLPRLAAGRYRITTTAEGYFAGTTEVDVAQSGAVTGIDQTLDKATAIGGTVSFASGPGAAGSVELRDAGGAVLDSTEFTAAGGPYVFYVETGGSFEVAVGAETYLDVITPVDVTTGVDITDLDFALVRQTEISGTVGFLEGDGRPGQISFLDAEGNALDVQGFPANGGAFQFFTPTGGDFRLVTETLPAIYVRADTTLAVTAGVDVTGLEIGLVLAAFIEGSVAFEGPDAAGRWDLYDNTSGAFRDSASVAVGGTPFGFYLEPGEFRLELQAIGYQERTVVFNVTENDTSLGALQLAAVRATRLEIVNDAGETQPEVRATYYDPTGDDPDPWTSSRVLLAARDDAGRDDLYDLDGNLTGFRLTARKLDDLSAPTGTPVFYSDATEATVDSVVSFSAGRAAFWMSNTAVEVLRVYLAQPDKDPIAGRIVVAFQDPRPATVVLSADGDTLTADGEEFITVTAQLYDSAGNPSLLDGIPVTFGVDGGSTGAGAFEEPTVLTNGDGRASGRLTATGAGAILVSASVVIENRVLDVAIGTPTSPDINLILTALAGATDGWRISLPASVADLGSPVTVTAQLIDRFGNATAEEGRSILFAAEPAALGTFEPALATSDADGRAQSVFTPSGGAGFVIISGDGGGLISDTVGLQLRDVRVLTDPVWTDEAEGRKTFDKTDLTALVIDNTPVNLVLELPFQSDWNGLQLHVLFETGFDAAGAAGDPFEQPVIYGHDDKPDFALTSKYSANDYGDFRKWDATAGKWLFWDLAGEAFADPATDQNIQPVWVSKEADKVVITMPWEAFGGAPDSLRLQVYLTQDDGEKRSAFDSVPDDATLNLDFDYLDPPPGAWDAATNPVTLTQWGRTYAVKTDFPTPPTVSEITITPTDVTAGETIILAATVVDAGDGIGDVLADLSEMGGSKTTRMHDDGAASHGDAVAGDGIYSLLTVVPVGNPGGSQTLRVAAYDGGNVWANGASSSLNVTAIVEPIIAVTDPVGDDHGPNQPGVARKYVTYPSNIVFVPGGFDLQGLTVFETVATVSGEQVEMIAFQVQLGDFPDPTDPGTADWNPLYADLNIEKIDILIDSQPGGSTASLPNRIAAFQPWDAWDYAIIMDGWYKALIPSEGTNTVDTWRENALRADKDILLIGDPELDIVTAFVSKAALGDPTPDDIRSWDIAVCMSSHDFGGEEVLGGIRWVNEFRSEWNFGGGRDGNRDSNLIDLLLVPGTGKSPGLPQETILDYETPEALARLERGETPVAIEMSQFEDTGPPVIDTGGGGSVVTRVTPLEDAPLALTMRISDDNRVAEAVFRYRSTGYEGGGWQREESMSFIGSDLWVVDILPTFLDSLVVSPIDSTRYLEFEVWAKDVPSGEPAVAKETTSPVTTLEIFPTATCLPTDTDLAGETVSLLEIDGSALAIGAELRNWLVREHITEAWTGGEALADTMGPFVDLQWDVCNVPEVIRTAPSVPPGAPIGVFREFFLATADSLGGYVDLTGALPRTLDLSLHYPEAWLPAGVDRDQLALYSYNEDADRWVLAGGNVNLTGNKVTAAVSGVGTYGLFATEAISQDDNEVISGVFVSPKAFSPNGDGVFDECSISFSLNREVSVTVEVFNIEGSRKNVLAQTVSYAGPDQGAAPRRIPGLVWDGTDFKGEVVPYGIYLVRIEATYNLGDGTERVYRENFSVAVIK